MFKNIVIIQKVKKFWKGVIKRCQPIIKRCQPITNILKKIVTNKFLFLVLIVSVVSASYAQKKYITSVLDNQLIKQRKYRMDSMSYKRDVKINYFTDILETFATISNRGLWIHTLKMSTSKTIEIDVRALDMDSLEKYVISLMEEGGFILKNIETTSVKALGDDGQPNSSVKPKALPMAVQRFFALTKKAPKKTGASDAEGGGGSAAKGVFNFQSKILLVKK